MICVWIVHVYAAIWVRGTIRAMTRGQVTGGWAWRHHRKWLRELVDEQAVTDKSAARRIERAAFIGTWPVWFVRLSDE